MGRYRESYTLYYRFRHNGKKIWYYKTYTPDGKRTAGKSTGCESKTRARLFCDELLKTGKLYGGSCKFFRDYATGFFDDNSPWFRDRMSCGTVDRPALSQSYIISIRNHLKRYLLPFFGDYKMEDLKPSLTKLFRAELLEKGIAPVGEIARPIAPKTINNVMSTLHLITDAALADGIIMLDPFNTIHPLRGNEKVRDAFLLSELKLIIQNLKDTPAFIPTIVSACTGMRISEIAAIRDETIFSDYIDVIDQFYFGTFQPLKTKEARKVPICKKLHEIVSSERVSTTYEKIRYTFDTAITAAGLWEEKKQRGLCFHSLRHFFNTFMLSENISPLKVAAVMGHSAGAGSMQERYTNWKPQMFPEVYSAQEKLLHLIL